MTLTRKHLSINVLIFYLHQFPVSAKEVQNNNSNFVFSLSLFCFLLSFIHSFFSRFLLFCDFRNWLFKRSHDMCFCYEHYFLLTRNIGGWVQKREKESKGKKATIWLYRLFLFFSSSTSSSSELSCSFWVSFFILFFVLLTFHETKRTET